MTQISSQFVPVSLLRPLRKVVMEHKNVIKLVAGLNSSITFFSTDVSRLINRLSAKFSDLWSNAVSECLPNDSSLGPEDVCGGIHCKETRNFRSQ